MLRDSFRNKISLYLISVRSMIQIPNYSISNFINKINSFFAYKLPHPSRIYLQFAVNLQKNTAKVE